MIERIAIIQEREEQITALKKQLTRKPGIEVSDKLKIKENEVREKARQMRAMAGELNMNQAQVSEMCKINTTKMAFILFEVFLNTGNFLCFEGK